MAEVFISYAREDQGFARDLNERLQKMNRATWVDWRSIPDSAQWRAEIFAAIEAADNFLFIISPDSLRSHMCGREVTHAVDKGKRIVAILYHPVDDDELLPVAKEIQWIKYPELGFEQTFQRLIAALNTDRDWVRQHTRLEGKAREWDSKQRNESFLLRGMDLQDAVKWLAQAAVVKKPKPSPLHEEYIRASQKWEAKEITRLEKLADREARQAKRFRRYSLALAVMLLLAVGAAGFAFWQRAVARARQLISASMASQDTEPELSVLIAARGVAATWPWGHIVLPEAEDQLHRTIVASHVRLTLDGHDEFVWSVAWSPDGKRLATGSYDKTARVWDAVTGKGLLTLSGHRGFVESVVWSPDGRRLATGSWDETVKVWNAATGKQLLTLSGHKGPVTSVAWSPDGERLITGSTDATARVWDAKTGEEIVTLTRHTGVVWSVAWSPNGEKVATGSADDTARVWDAAMGKELLTLRGNAETDNRLPAGIRDDSVSLVAWSPDSKRLATGGQGGTPKVWDAVTGKMLLTLPEYRVWSVAWSPDGRRLATGSRDTARVWDAASGGEVLTLRGHRRRDQGPILSYSGSVISNGRRFSYAGSFVTDGVLALAWSPDSQRLATGSIDCTAKVWDVTAGWELLTLNGSGYARGLAWSPDGHRLATGSRDNTAKVREASTGHELLSLRGHSANVNAVAWSPDGKRLATASWDGTAKVWEAATGKELLTLSGHSDVIESVVWSPDGKRLATASWDGTAKVWDATTGRALLTLSDQRGQVYAVAWSPDGNRLATGNQDGTGKMWDAATGRKLLTLSGHSNTITSVAWSPEGNRLATGGWDEKAKVWDAVTGRELLTLSTHTGPVSSVTWSPDGKRVATGSRDETTKLWDGTTGKELLTLGGQSDYVYSVIWRPDGKQLATATDNGTIHIYAMDIRDLMALARQRVTERPSAEGCRKYLHMDKCPPFPELPWW
jgi:WD40 repeat protein